MSNSIDKPIEEPVEDIAEIEAASHNIPQSTAVTNANTQAAAQNQSTEGTQRLRVEFIDLEQSRFSRKRTDRQLLRQGQHGKRQTY